LLAKTPQEKVEYVRRLQSMVRQRKLIDINIPISVEPLSIPSEIKEELLEQIPLTKPTLSSILVNLNQDNYKELLKVQRILKLTLNGTINRLLSDFNKNILKSTEI